MYDRYGLLKVTLIVSSFYDFDLEPDDFDAVCNRYRESRSAIVT